MQAVQDAAQAVLQDIQSKFAARSQQPSAMESLQAFCAAVDWKEPWILSLLAVQILLFVTVISARKQLGVLAVLFGIATAIAFNAESLNGMARRRWRSFSGQNYFDPHGVFWSALVSGPLLLDMFIILILYLWSVYQSMVKMKRGELRAKARERARAEKLDKSS
eukprot:jgi/Astpho2/9973/e_gw1.00153.62.1_t